MASAWQTLGVEPHEGVAAIRDGLAVEQLHLVLERTGLSTDAVLQILGVTSHDVSTRQRLTQAESERLWRVAEVFSVTLSFFDDDTSKAAAWLEAPLNAFGNIAPLMHAATEPGANEVRTLIWQLEHGVAA